MSDGNADFGPRHRKLLCCYYRSCCGQLKIRDAFHCPIYGTGWEFLKLSNGCVFDLTIEPIGQNRLGAELGHA